MKAIKAIYNGIDKFNDFLGRIFSVLSLAILAVIMCEVILRRIFNRPQIWTQDLDVYKRQMGYMEKMMTKPEIPP